MDTPTVLIFSDKVATAVVEKRGWSLELDSSSPLNEWRNRNESVRYPR